MKHIQPHALSYSERVVYQDHPLAKRLLSLMDSKKTNLALSADLTTKQSLLDMADRLGPEICIFKTHIDIIEDFDQSLIDTLKEIANYHQFLIFEDRKFADIGNTVYQQYQGGIYRIVEWADIVNAHTLPGPSVVQGLKKAGMPKERGCLLIAQMSSRDSNSDDSYSTRLLKIALEQRDFVFGFITRQRLLNTPDFIYMTAGIGLNEGGDDLGQTYIDPHKAITEYYTDIIIVGRGIVEASNPLEAAKEFRQRGWDAYQARCS